jgi:hypothetical protein
MIMSTVILNETQLYINLHLKLNNIKEKLDKIKNYSESFDNQKQIAYIEKLLVLLRVTSV